MKYEWVLILLLIFSSCSFLDSDWIIPEEIKTKEEAAMFMNECSYIPESGANWQLPETTYNKRGGDCEDLSGLLAHIFIYCMNIEDVRLVGCVSMEGGPHMMVKADGIYYEGQTGQKKKKKKKTTRYFLVYEMSYDAYIFWAKVK